MTGNDALRRPWVLAALSGVLRTVAGTHLAGGDDAAYLEIAPSAAHLYLPLLLPASAA